jgi:U6 snRNA m6A methyltransferase
MCVIISSGNTVYGWKFVATEIDPESVTLAEANVARNHLSHKISVLPVAAGSYFLPVIAAHPSIPVFEFCMCNPPFFADVSEACSHPEHGTAGTSTELATAGCSS